jgi:hypothetical protein
MPGSFSDHSLSALGVTMDDPADLINTALEALILASLELPAFSALDRLAGEIQTSMVCDDSREIGARQSAATRYAGPCSRWEVGLPAAEGDAQEGVAHASGRVVRSSDLALVLGKRRTVARRYVSREAPALG